MITIPEAKVHFTLNQDKMSLTGIREAPKRFEEFDPAGRSLWKLEGAFEHITRLPNGSLLILDGLGNRKRLFELDRDKRLAWEAPMQSFGLSADCRAIFLPVRLGFDNAPRTLDDQTWFRRRVDDCRHPDAARRYLALNSLRLDFPKWAREAHSEILKGIESKAAPQIPGTVTWDYMGRYRALVEDLGLPRK